MNELTNYQLLTQFIPSGLLYLNSLDQSIYSLKGVWSVFIITMLNWNAFNYANSVEPDAASDLGLHCLPMSHLWDARHKWVNQVTNKHVSIDPLLLNSYKKYSVHYIANPIRLGAKTLVIITLKEHPLLTLLSILHLRHTWRVLQIAHNLITSSQPVYKWVRHTNMTSISKQ